MAFRVQLASYEDIKECARVGTEAMGTYCYLEDAWHYFHNQKPLKRKIQICLIDAVIIFAGGVIFGWHKAIYSVLTVWIVSTVSEKIMNGPNNAKACIIVSAQSECISGRIIKEVQRGITGLYGRGMYMKRDELVLLCVVSVREVSAIRKIVYEEDKKAFMTTSNVSEVIGEGFIDW